MKHRLLFVYLILIAESGQGSAQMSQDIDRAPRLFVASNSQAVNYHSQSYETNYYFDYYGDQKWHARDLWRNDTFDFNYSHCWDDGPGGNGQWLDQFADVTESGTNSSVNMEQFNWPAPSLWPGAINNYGEPLVLAFEHCETQDPQDIGIATDDPWDGMDFGVLHDRYNRTAQTVVTLQTGGKSLSHRKSLWAVNAMANHILDKRAAPDGYTDCEDDPTHSLDSAPSEPIASAMLQINGKQVRDDGFLYFKLPDGGAIDLTPTISGLDFYTFSVTAQKFTCYFTAYVDMPGPPPSHVTHIGWDYGHAWWMFDSDSPADIVDLFTSTNRSHFLNEQVGYADNHHAIGPGVLRDPETNQNISTSKAYEIGFDGLLAGLAYTQGVHDNPGTYNVGFNNCVQHVIKAGAAAGLTLPEDTKPETFGWDLINSP